MTKKVRAAIVVVHIAIPVCRVVRPAIVVVPTPPPETFIELIVIHGVAAVNPLRPGPFARNGRLGSLQGASVLATRKPVSAARATAESEKRKAERRNVWLRRQEPPRTTRALLFPVVLALPSRGLPVLLSSTLKQSSVHSQTFPCTL